MAVDTRNKRASCLGVALFVCAVYPNPDGTLGVAADRMHMAYAYASGSSTSIASAVSDAPLTLSVPSGRTTTLTPTGRTRTVVA